MLTYEDCVAFCDLSPEELSVIARHEHLPDIVAAEKGHAFLRAEWGNPALRQMLVDQIAAAIRQGDRETALSLMTQLRECCERHPGGVDRRRRDRRH